MTQTSESNGQIYAEFRNGNKALDDGDPLKLSSKYFIRVWLGGLEPSSIWIGKSLTITLYSGDRVVQLEKWSDSVIVSTANTTGEEPVEFIEFPFQLGANPPEKNLAIFYVDVFYGYKLLVRVTCIRKVDS